MLSAAALRLAARRLVRAPAFTSAAILTLALGIGGTVAVFTVVNGVLIQPLPYPHADRLVDLSHTLEISGLARVDQSDATYLLYRRDNHVFTDVGAYRSTAANMDVVASGAAPTPARVAEALVTPSTFRVLDAHPVRGRGLTDADATPGAPPVVLIGAGLWRRDFGGSAAAIGRFLSVNGVERQIVGVMPADFGFPAPQTALWVPLQFDPAHTASAAFDYRAVARLRDGVTPAEAAADLQRLLPQVPVVFPGRLTAGAIRATHMAAVVRPLRDVMVAGVARTLWIVLGAVGALLLVACANVANLFLARAEGRQRELAVRRALGAGRRALLDEFLSEGLLLSVIGGALGLACASVGVGLIRAMPAGSSIPRLGEAHVDGFVLVFTAGLVVASALIVSALPITRAGQGSLSALLASEGRSATGARVRHRARRTLVVSQVALALVLLAGAGLCARSFQRLLAVRPGFDAAHALSFRVALPGATYPSAGDAARVIASTLGALDGVAGVQTAGAVTKLPLENEAVEDSAVFIEDHPLRPGQLPDVHPIVFASSGYFRAMAVSIVAGRLFARFDPSLDPAHAPREAVVSEAFARRYWPDGSAVGKRIRMNPVGPWSTIVGVVASVHDAGLDRSPPEAVYLPMLTSTLSGAPFTPHDVAFVVRTSGDPSTLAAGVRAAVRRVAPALPLYRLVPMEQLLDDSASRTTFTMLLLGIAAVVATVIGAAGIYGVVAYLVSLRTREFGVRLALGAQPSHVRRLVIHRALVDAGVGVVAGLAGALVLTRLLSSVLFGLSGADPLVLGGASVVLLVTAVAAGWLPARRAAALDPAAALRDG